MNRQALSSFSIQQLQHYKQTLLTRIKQTKAFNVELSRDNIDLAAKLNEVRIKAHEKKVSKDNFDFDDLYKLGKEKVAKLATKDGITGIFKTGGKQIKKGYSFAGKYMKNLFHKNKQQKSNEEEIDAEADFNSYNIQPHRPKPYNPTPVQQQFLTKEETQTRPKRRNIFTRGQKDDQFDIKVDKEKFKEQKIQKRIEEPQKKTEQKEFVNKIDREDKEINKEQYNGYEVKIDEGEEQMKMEIESKNDDEDEEETEHEEISIVKKESTKEIKQDQQSEEKKEGKVEEKEECKMQGHEEEKHMDENKQQKQNRDQQEQEIINPKQQQQAQKNQKVKGEKPK